MARRNWARALSPIPSLTALGVALAGCVGDARPAPRYYGGGYYGVPSGYYGSPYYDGRYGYGGPFGGYDRYYGGPRGYYGGGRDYHAPRPQVRIEGPGTQELLQRHWMDKLQRAR